MTTTIGRLMFRAATGVLGALTCTALAAAQPQFERGKRAKQFLAKS